MNEQTTLFRQWLILGKINRHPRRTSAADLEAYLQLHGVEVTRRTLERDLCDLMEHPFFPIEHDAGKPRGWYFPADTGILDIPGMEPSTALTFHLLGQFTCRILPKTVCDRLKPYQDRAADVLKQLPESKFARWPAKIRYLPRGQVLLPPKIGPAVLDTVYESLLYEKQIKVAYRAAHRKEPIEYVLHPLGLVVREPVIYLVAIAGEHPDPYVYLLHRIAKAELVQELRRVPKGFDLDKFIESGALGIIEGEKPITLKVLLRTPQSVTLFTETPLSKDQAFAEEGGRTILIATVPDTAVLRTFLVGLEDTIEVLSPLKLRTDMKEIIGRMGKLY